MIAGYLVWLRSKFSSPVSPQTAETISVTPTEVMTPTPMASPSATATPSATPKSGSKTSTSSSGIK